MPATPHPHLRFLAALALALLPSTRSVARQSDPEPVVAWLTIDTSAIGPATDAAAQRRVVDSLAAWFAPNRLIQDLATTRLLTTLIADSLVHAAPLTLCIFELHEESPADPAPPELGEVRLVAAVSIDTAGIAPPEARDEFKSRLAALVAGADAHRRVTLHERAEIMDVGLGEGAFERWSALAAKGPAPTTQLAMHRQTAGAARAGTRPGLECFIDIDRLRRAFPARFDHDPGERLLRSLHLSNARSFMFHARVTPGEKVRISLDATWSVRSEPRETIHRIGITGDGPLPDGVRAGASIDAQWAPWTIGMLDAYGSILSGRDAEVFARERRSWSLRALPVLVRFASSVEPACTVELDAAEPGCTLGAFVIRVPLAQDAKRDEVFRDFTALLHPFSPRTAAAERTTIRTFQREPPDPVRIITWGMIEAPAGPELVIGLGLGWAPPEPRTAPATRENAPKPK